MSSLARDERASLCDLFDKLGADEPTLCEGWQTRDLAAHLVLREGRLDAVPGIVVPFLSGWTERVQASLASGDFRRLVRRLRVGPPWWSPYRPRRLDEAANGIEFFVHHEDVRRAQPGWAPRTLEPAVDEMLWRRARSIAHLRWRRLPCGAILVRDDGEQAVVRTPPSGTSSISISGPPQELLMFVFGRRDHALVEKSGDAAALAAL